MSQSLMGYGINKSVSDEVCLAGESVAYRIITARNPKPKKMNGSRSSTAIPVITGLNGS
jgi:hypothetical protein